MRRARPPTGPAALHRPAGPGAAGIATPDEWLATASRHGATARLLALDPRRFPHDVASLGRYGRALATLPRAVRPWSPLGTDDALEGLARAGLALLRGS